MPIASGRFFVTKGMNMDRTVGSDKELLLFGGFSPEEVARGAILEALKIVGTIILFDASAPTEIEATRERAERLDTDAKRAEELREQYPPLLQTTPEPQGLQEYQTLPRKRLYVRSFGNVALRFTETCQLLRSSKREPDRASRIPKEVS